jgi:hypothetical protein
VPTASRGGARCVTDSGEREATVCQRRGKAPSGARFPCLAQMAVRSHFLGHGAPVFPHGPEGRSGLKIPCRQRRESLTLSSGTQQPQRLTRRGASVPRCVSGPTLPLTCHSATDTRAGSATPTSDRGAPMPATKTPRHHLSLNEPRTACALYGTARGTPSTVRRLRPASCCSAGRQ